MTTSRSDAIERIKALRFSPEKVFLLLSLLLSAFYLATVSPLRDYLHGPERFLHVIDYAQSLRGEPGQMPAGFIDLVWHRSLPKQMVPYASQRLDWMVALREQQYHMSPRDAALADIPLSPDITVPFETTKNASTYSPVGYLPFALPAVAGITLGLAPVTILYLMIASNLLLSIALAYAAIRTTPILKWAFAFLLLLPTLCINRLHIMPDALSIATCFLMVALVLKDREGGLPLTPRRWMAYIALSGVIGLLKVTYFFIAAIVLLLPKASFPHAKARLLFLAVVLTAGIVPAMGWNIHTAQKYYFVPTQVNEADVPREGDAYFIATGQEHKAYIARMLDNPFGYLYFSFMSPLTPPVFKQWVRNMFFWDGDRWLFQPVNWYNEIQLPIVGQVATIGLIMAVLLALFPPPPGQAMALRRNDRLLCCAIFFAVYAVVVGFNYVFHNQAITPFVTLKIIKPIAFDTFRTIIQGRYFLPILPLLLVAVSRPMRGQGNLQRTLLAAALSLLVLMHWLMLRSF